jgi:uncharacterized integral membrane protein
MKKPPVPETMLQLAMPAEKSRWPVVVFILIAIVAAFLIYRYASKED